MRILATALTTLAKTLRFLAARLLSEEGRNLDCRAWRSRCFLAASSSSGDWMPRSLWILDSSRRSALLLLFSVSGEILFQVSGMRCGWIEDDDEDEDV
ncbi:hypothetical protein F4778DRAFT_370963 [Xylariomycetidae sp. FL2044]|nr:hypothetical protein F4778DRAFT_370963 [Xylariomycetidae sp. FL2044]